MHNHCAILLNIGIKHNQMLAQVKRLPVLTMAQQQCAYCALMLYQFKGALRMG